MSVEIVDRCCSEILYSYTSRPKVTTDHYSGFASEVRQRVHNNGSPVLPTILDVFRERFLNDHGRHPNHVETADMWVKLVVQSSMELLCRELGRNIILDAEGPYRVWGTNKDECVPEQSTATQLNSSPNVVY